MDNMDIPPLDEEALADFSEQIGELPEEHAGWVAQLFLECQRARAAEARLGANVGTSDADTTQVVLDTAEWLKTLWEVGYMGSEAFPAQPRTAFPQVNVEDILKSALLARIRQGKHPLPFPPPTRHGVPWHEVVESELAFAVHAKVTDDGWANVEGCNEWRVVGVEDGTERGTFRVQHRGKGPIYRLTLNSDGDGRLQRCPSTIARRITRQSRAGIDSYLLEWPRDGGDTIAVPLRATHWERAESEAQRWIALRHPDLYGQIHFERSEA